MSRTLKYKTVRVNKPHPCEQCGRIIAVGETAHYWVGIGDDGFVTSYVCPRCRYLWGELWDKYGDYDFGLWLPDVMSDYESEISPTLVALWRAPGADFVRPA